VRGSVGGGKERSGGKGGFRVEVEGLGGLGEREGRKRREMR